jgi:hypothetical protein
LAKTNILKEIYRPTNVIFTMRQSALTPTAHSAVNHATSASQVETLGLVSSPDLANESGVRATRKGETVLLHEADIQSRNASRTFQKIGFRTEYAFNKNWLLQRRRETKYFTQRPQTYTYILLCVLWFWGIAGFQFQRQNVESFKEAYQSGAEIHICGEIFCCGDKTSKILQNVSWPKISPGPKCSSTAILAQNTTKIMEYMDQIERIGHPEYYTSHFCRFNLGCAWQFGFHSVFITPNGVLSNFAYFFVALLMLVSANASFFKYINSAL